MTCSSGATFLSGLLFRENNFCFELHILFILDIAVNVTQDGGFSPWQPWSQCSADCDTGSQYRRRSCDDPQPLGYGRECQGHLVEARQCNVHSCKGVWGCWSEFSICSASCGHGSRVRIRRCASSVPGTNFKIPCDGHDTDYHHCSAAPCNVSAGWDVWSTWTECDVDELQFRHRKCQTDMPTTDECQGHRLEYQGCVYTPYKVAVAPVQEREDEIRKYALSHLIIVASGAFVFGIMLTIGLYLCVKSCRSFRKFDLEKERKKNPELNNGKRKCGSLSSQLSLDFLTINNKVYDASTLPISKDKFVSSKNSINSFKRLEAMRTDLQSNEV